MTTRLPDRSSVRASLIAGRRSWMDVSDPATRDPPPSLVGLLGPEPQLVQLVVQRLEDAAQQAEQAAAQAQEDRPMRVADRAWRDRSRPSTSGDPQSAMPVRSSDPVGVLSCG